jgi:hypothetical protein
MTDPAGRADHLVLHGIGVHSLRETKELLRANGTQILGLATETMNVAILEVADDGVIRLQGAIGPRRARLVAGPGLDVGFSER